ncbi:hypothetical protein WMY93_018485 [Mugilogobius chulae]|uniref:DBB domain-containing protein n=1 Tax=Mugilogobius chulae TaxID=88201 RepID=A0AAW0NJC8_9GOBI
MEEDLQTGAALHDASSTYELLILYTSEAYEWATYLQHILQSSRKFPKSSIVLYAVSPADQLHGYNFDSFQNCKCVVLLLTGAFLDDLSVPELQGALRRLLCPPHRVVALLCGVDDDPALTESFSDWPYWRKLYTEDEPAVYLATILESVAENLPAGVVSLTLRTNQSSVALKPITYFTNMGEVSRFIENATDPVNFICQAFHLQSNTTESVDNMLTECLKSKMRPQDFSCLASGRSRRTIWPHISAMRNFPRCSTLQLSTVEEAHYALLKCPGALQAYSVMNKNGDYPNTLAQKSGFSDLRQFMDAFVVMTAVDENPEEAMLRKFFQAKNESTEAPQSDSRVAAVEEKESTERTEFDLIEEEDEDPYHLSSDDIYDTVDPESMYPPILNRPPAPIPRPEPEADREEDKPIAYISRIFSDKNLTQLKQEIQDKTYATARRPSVPQGPVYDPYAGMKTPGQRQLISLQERVKVGEISVEEAVQEFKAWQFDHDRRSNSIRYQQENLKKLRDSITRRHKEKEKIGQMEYEISAPLQTNLYWTTGASPECGVYESTPRVSTLPPLVLCPQRPLLLGPDTSSREAAGRPAAPPATPDSLDCLPVPPRPPRLTEPSPLNTPPRIPPRIPERVPEKMLHDRYISCPTRALPQVPQRSPRWLLLFPGDRDDPNNNNKTTTGHRERRRERLCSTTKNSFTDMLYLFHDDKDEQQRRRERLALSRSVPSVAGAAAVSLTQLGDVRACVRASCVLLLLVREGYSCRPGEPREPADLSCRSEPQIHTMKQNGMRKCHFSSFILLAGAGEVLQDAPRSSVECVCSLERLTYNTLDTGNLDYDHGEFPKSSCPPEACVFLIPLTSTEQQQQQQQQ